MLPRKRLDLREVELVIFGVHGQDLRFVWRAEDFDDFDELVDSAVAGEDGLSEH